MSKIPGYSSINKYAKAVDMCPTTVWRQMQRGVCTWPREVHDGKHKHPFHQTYINMRNRCYNPNCHNYPRYGGRGIRMCPEWYLDFWQFVKDMGPKPFKKASIDRIDNNGDYTPENCRWSDGYTQATNRSTNTKTPNIRKFPTGWKARLSIAGKLQETWLTDSYEQAIIDLGQLRKVYCDFL